MLTEYGMAFCVEITWKVKVLLSHLRRRPSASLELVVLPADAVVSASELILGDLAVNFDHGTLNHSDVLLFSQSTKRASVDTR